MKSRKQPSKEDKRTIEHEVRRVFADYDEKNVREIEAMTLWALHELFGFGPKRLRRFYNRFNKEVRGLISRYRMEEDDMDWLCTRQLKEYGIDIVKWREELKDAE